MSPRGNALRTLADGVTAVAHLGCVLPADVAQEVVGLERLAANLRALADKADRGECSPAPSPISPRCA